MLSSCTYTLLLLLRWQGIISKPVISSFPPEHSVGVVAHCPHPALHLEHHLSFKRSWPSDRKKCSQWHINFIIRKSQNEINEVKKRTPAMPSGHSPWAVFSSRVAWLKAVSAPSCDNICSQKWTFWPFFECMCVTFFSQTWTPWRPERRSAW